ncbi:MAG TPA: DmsC/YnfH family molybdoenzyme membrane anchor subunit [Alphaproteobacteria bacterium]
MHPAASVILFTTTSGAGYGLLALLGLLGPAGLVPQGRWFGFAGLGLALALITAGLLASTFHLGRPERAWRAVSQWRSSWLSREGLMALATYVPAVVFGIGWVFLKRTGGGWAAAGVLAAFGAALTVVCTGMIYASLKPIRQWRDPLVPPLYLAFALASGALCLNALVNLFGVPSLWIGALAFAALAGAWILKLVYWRRIDAPTDRSTPESATGLGALGTVRQLDPPHSEENYLLREMGFRVARKHAVKLRRIALAAGAALPLALIAAQLATGGATAGAFAVLAVLAAALGVAIERWLFFAEATHTVTLYYGRQI